MAASNETIRALLQQNLSQIKLDPTQIERGPKAVLSDSAAAQKFINAKSSDVFGSIQPHSKITDSFSAAAIKLSGYIARTGMRSAVISSLQSALALERTGDESVKSLLEALWSMHSNPDAHNLLCVMLNYLFDIDDKLQGNVNSKNYLNYLLYFTAAWIEPMLEAKAIQKIENERNIGQKFMTLFSSTIFAPAELNQAKTQILHQDDKLLTIVASFNKGVNELNKLKFAKQQSPSAVASPYSSSHTMPTAHNTQGKPSLLAAGIKTSPSSSVSSTPVVRNNAAVDRPSSPKKLIPSTSSAPSTSAAPSQTPMQKFYYRFEFRGWLLKPTSSSDERILEITATNGTTLALTPNNTKEILSSVKNNLDTIEDHFRKMQPTDRSFGVSVDKRYAERPSSWANMPPCFNSRTEHNYYNLGLCVEFEGASGSIEEFQSALANQAVTVSLDWWKPFNLETCILPSPQPLLGSNTSASTSAPSITTSSNMLQALTLSPDKETDFEAGASIKNNDTAASNVERPELEKSITPSFR